MTDTLLKTTSLLDRGIFDSCPVRILSLEPPGLSAGLSLLFGRTEDGTVASEYA